MRIMIVINSDVGLYKFRRELVEELLRTHEVHICNPKGDYVHALVKMGCVYHAYEFDRHGINPLAEMKQFFFYKQLLKKVEPDIVFTYTVKPNIYAGMACASLKIPYIANVTGLGGAIENGGLMKKLLLLLYKFGLRKAQKVFFQNESNRDFMLSHGIVRGPFDILPGSGVNLQEHNAEPYPEKESPIILVNIGRIMKDKGSDEILYAAREIRKDYPDVVFRLIGEFDGAYEEKVRCVVDAGYIEFLGKQSDVHSCLKEAHAIVHASYHEGMSNVLLEAAACARPIVATAVPGCREAYDDNISGIACRARDGEDLVRAIRKFIELPYSQKAQMGRAGRRKAESTFDRAIVIQKYLEEIKEVKYKG